MWQLKGVGRCSVLQRVTVWCSVLQCDDDDCFYYHSWRNNVGIAFGTLSSLAVCCSVLKCVRSWYILPRVVDIYYRAYSYGKLSLPVLRKEVKLQLNCGNCHQNKFFFVFGVRLFIYFCYSGTQLKQFCVLIQKEKYGFRLISTKYLFATGDIFHELISSRSVCVWTHCNTLQHTATHYFFWLPDSWDTLANLD